MSDPLDAWKPWPVCPAEGCEETEDVTRSNAGYHDVHGLRFAGVGGLQGVVMIPAGLTAAVTQSTGYCTN